MTKSNPYDNSFSFYGEDGSFEPEPFYGDFIPGTDEFDLIIYR